MSQLLKSMLENRRANNLAIPVQAMSLNQKTVSPGSHAYKKKIIEDKPKHKHVIPHFEALVDKYSNDNDSDSDED